MTENSPFYRDWNGDVFTIEELRGKYEEDYATLRMYQTDRGEEDLTDEEFDEKYSFEEWLNSGIYTLVEDDDEEAESDEDDGFGSDALTIDRKSAEAENGFSLEVYRLDDGRILRWEELADEVKAEVAHLPEESWEGGKFDINDYIVEACHTGIYKSVNVYVAIITLYARPGERPRTSEEVHDEVYAYFKEPIPYKFDVWLGHAVNAGIYRQVDVLRYRSEDDDQIVTERVIA